MKILAFETSCDETSAAVLDGEKILSNIVLSQMFHSEWGGVVPEIASREHLKNIVRVMETALKDAKIKLSEIELIAATNEPGLVGALLIGFSYAKSLAMTLDVPFIPVNHIQAHLYSSFIENEKPEFPFLSLIVSGGHTIIVLVKNFFVHEILGITVDDAAGECFDKVAKLLGLGYPGGPLIDEFARQGNKKFHRFPLANVKGAEFNFSFSGIKTSVLYYLREIQFDKINNKQLVADICASFQEAVTETLFRKTLDAAKKNKIKTITLSGGVSANSELKRKFENLKSSNYRIFIPSPKYSTDNGAMIGYTAYLKYENAEDKNYFRTESFAEKVNPKFTSL